MVLDTGSAMTILDRSLDATFWEPDADLMDAEVSIKGSSGKVVPVEPVRLHHIQCGPWGAEHPKAIRLDLSTINRFLDEPVDGVIGINLLEGRSFWLDFRNRLVQWDRHPEGVRLQPLKIGSIGKTPKILLEVSGRPVEATCDTGFSGFMSVSAERARALTTAHDSESESISVDVIGVGKQLLPPTISGTVTFGPLAWCKSEVEVAKSNLLGTLAMWPGAWFDFKQHVVGLAADASGCLGSQPPIRQPLHAYWDRSTNPPRLIVLGVKPNSRYESAGLRADDVLLEFGDLKAGSLDLTSLRKALLEGTARRLVIERNGRKQLIELPEVK